ncbi:MAG: MATE family efflux transporter [Candidatus Limivicinus sp.]
MTRDMTTGSPLARILAFCAPLLVGNLFQQFYNLADSIIVGRLLGVNAFAAVGSTGALNFLVLGFALGICSGFAIPIAQSFGAGDEEAVRSRTGQLVWLGLIFSLGLTVLTFFTTDDILHLINTPAEIYNDAYKYIFIVFMGAGATILYNLSSSILRALGDSRTPLLFLIAAVIVNVVLDILFMATCGMGVEGAALATVISQAASGLACLLYIHARVPALHLSGSHLRPSLRRMGYIASIGVPMGLQFSITAVGSIILQGAVNSLGAGAVAAVSAGSRVHNIMAAPMETAGITMATYCGQNLGAGKPDRIRKGVMAITWVTIGYALLAFGVNYFAGTSIACLFMDASETAILAQVHRYLTINGAAYPLLVLIFIFRNSLQGMGYSSSAMFAGLAELIARSIVAFGFVGRFAFGAVCFANPLAWLFADLILLPLYAVKLRRLDVRFAAQAQEEDSSLTCLPSPKCKKA